MTYRKPNYCIKGIIQVLSDDMDPDAVITVVVKNTIFEINNA